MANEGLGHTRMEAISDGVFAVAMTLMLADAVTKDGVREWRCHSLEKGLLFLVTFGLASIYWVAHNNECRYIQRTDRSVLWLNLLFVATVAFVPVSVNMLGVNDMSAGKAFTQIYLLNLMLMGVFLELWFVILWSKGFLTREGNKQGRNTACRNAVPPLAILVLLAAIWIRGFEFMKNANWWLVDDDHIRAALAIPLVGYVLMTLALDSRKPGRIRFINISLIVLLVCDVVTCVILFLVYPKPLPDFVIGLAWLALLRSMVYFFEPSGPHEQST